MDQDVEDAFHAMECETLATLAAKSIESLLERYYAAQVNGSGRVRRFCFALFVFPEGAPGAALVTNSTREFALDMCKLWIQNEEAS